MRRRSTPAPLHPALLIAGLLAAGATVSTLGATFNQAHAETRNWSILGFTGVAASAGVNVELQQGPHAITAEGAAKDIDRLDISKDGDVLRVSRKSGLGGWSSGRVVVTVSAPQFTELSASSGADVNGTGLKLERLSTSVSSGADMDLSGTCLDIKISASSGADFDGENFKCETASADASSGADIDIWASKSASGEASSGADVTFLGSPAAQSKDTSSGGSVNFR